MRLLLIDNGISNPKTLQVVLAKHDITTVLPDTLHDVTADDYDAIIIAGTYDNGLMWEKPYFLAEVELLRMTTRPVLGLGLGFELICYAYGNQLHEEAEKLDAAPVVTPTADGTKLFQGADPIKVVDCRRWAVYEVAKDLAVLATSDTGIEAVRHKTRPVYGLQLLPEDFKYASDGTMVYANILDGFHKVRAS